MKDNWIKKHPDYQPDEENGGILYEDELAGARKTLNAAAMTYVAAVATSLVQLLRLIAIYGRRRRD